MPECQSCGCDVDHVREYENGRPMFSDNLCDICASTLIGNAHFFPDQYDGKLMKTMAQIGNIIIAEIRKLKE